MMMLNDKVELYFFSVPDSLGNISLIHGLFKVSKYDLELFNAF